MNISEQTIDSQVHQAMIQVEALRKKAQDKQDEAQKLGGYKTKCLIQVRDEIYKINTVNLETLIKIGDYILEKSQIRGETAKRLGISSKKSIVNTVQDYTVDEWFHDLRICVLKQEALALLNKANEREKIALSLESDLNKRHRAVSNLLKSFEEDEE